MSLFLKSPLMSRFLLSALCLTACLYANASYADVYIPYQKATLQILNKITAKTTNVTVTLKQPFTFEHKITITMQSCFATSPQDVPESVAFLNITQKKADLGDAPVFAGWMFAKHPALSVLQNPLYDIRVLSCTPPALPGSVTVQPPLQATSNDQNANAEDADQTPPSPNTNNDKQQTQPTQAPTNNNTAPNATPSSGNITSDKATSNNNTPPQQKPLTPQPAPSNNVQGNQTIANAPPQSSQTTSAPSQNSVAPNNKQTETASNAPVTLE